MCVSALFLFHAKMRVSLLTSVWKAPLVCFVEYAVFFYSQTDILRASIVLVSTATFRTWNIYPFICCVWSGTKNSLTFDNRVNSFCYNFVSQYYTGWCGCCITTTWALHNLL